MPLDATRLSFDCYVKQQRHIKLAHRPLTYFLRNKTVHEEKKRGTYFLRKKEEEDTTVYFEVTVGCVREMATPGAFLVQQRATFSGQGLRVGGGGGGIRK